MELNLTGKTVLLVDDEKFSRATVARLLEDMGHPHLVHAANGMEAMEQLSSGNHHIDMIISDFNMPLKHGLELLKSVRTGERNIGSHMPFAMLTGYSDKHLVDMALALDVNAFLIKPVSKSALEARLGKMFRQVQSDNWLKSSREYKEIDVETALEDIVGIARPSKDQPKARGVFVLRKNKPLFRSPTGSDVFGDDDLKAHNLEDEALSLDDSVQAPVQKARQLDGYECPLDQVPAGAMLARDVHTADGRLFMHAGSHLSARVVSILIDLQDLGHPVDSVWIAK